MQNETQKEIAGIQSATSRQNTKDQVYAQNEMLAYQQKVSTARVASIMENTNLSKQQQVSEIMRQMLTQAQTAGQDRKSGSAGMPRPISYAVFCLKKKRRSQSPSSQPLHFRTLRRPPRSPLFPYTTLFRSRKTRYMHKMRCLLINRRCLLLALRLLWKTPIFPSNSRFPRLCAKCLLKLKRLVSILPMTKSKK